MDTFEKRVRIQFLFLAGVATKQIHERLLNVYMDLSPSPSIRTVEGWVAELKRSRTNLEDEPRERPPDRDLVRALGISLDTLSVMGEGFGFPKSGWLMAV